MTDLTLGLAFIAGLVSFVSPCVLPLVPAYVGYMGGQVTTQVASAGGNAVVARRNRFGTFVHGMFFVLGFTFVFVTFGLLTTAGSLALRGSVVDVQEILSRLGGMIIILFGLHVMGLLPKFIVWVIGKAQQMNSGTGLVATLVVQVAIAVLLAWSLVTPVAAIVGVGLYALWLILGGALTSPGDFWQKNLTRLQTALYMDTRKQMQPNKEAGYAGSALMGVVFSAGWTPCIGPVYGAVLTMAANGGSLGQAGTLLTAYSLGLGVPFLLTALMMNQMQGLLRRLQRRMRTIELVSGIFLLVIGFMVMTGQLQRISQIGASGDFSYNLEYCVTELVNGELGLGDFGTCLDQGPSFGSDAEASVPLILEPEPTPMMKQTNTENGADSAPFSVLEMVDPISSEAEPVAGLPQVGLGEGFLAPGFSTVSFEGEPFVLRSAGGRVTLLNFWATWCGPCRIEMPHLQAAYEQYADDGLEILAINRGESVERVAAFKDEFALTFPLLMDQSEVITGVDYQVFSMPTTFVLNEDGVILARHFGALAAEQLDEMLQEAFSLAG